MQRRIVLKDIKQFLKLPRIGWREIWLATKRFVISYIKSSKISTINAKSEIICFDSIESSKIFKLNINKVLHSSAPSHHLDWLFLLSGFLLYRSLRSSDCTSVVSRISSNFLTPYPSCNLVHLCRRYCVHEHPYRQYSTLNLWKKL